MMFDALAIFGASAKRNGKHRKKRPARRVRPSGSRKMRLEALEVRQLLAGVEQVTELGGWESSDPAYLTVFNNQLYFAATTEEHGRELWKVDDAGTATQVDDIAPGADDSDPEHLTVFNNQLYFSASGEDGDRELWKVGTSGPATKAADIDLDDASEPEYLTEFNSKLYFTATRADCGRELWMLGTSGDPVLVDDIVDGDQDSEPRYLTVFNNQLYFSAFAEDGDRELWKIGTSGSATMVVNIDPDPDGASEPEYLTVFNNALYFHASTIDDGMGLWKVTTSGSASMVTALDDITSPPFLTVFNNELYFSGVKDERGRELWKVNGVGAVTMAADINPVGDSNPEYLRVFNSSLYFSATTEESGAELWKLDPSGVAQRMTEINSVGDSLPASLTVFNNQLYFGAFKAEKGRELWKIGAAGTAQAVADINTAGDPDPQHLAVFDDRLYFRASTDPVQKLWMVNGEGTVELTSDLTTAADPWSSTVFNNELYFSASGESAGVELWKLDASGAVELVDDIYSGIRSSNPEYLTVFNGQLYFTACKSTGGYELYRLNVSGSAELAADVYAGNTGSHPRYLTVFNNALYFSASTAETGNELWKFDGSGTAQLAADVNTGFASSNPGPMTVFNDALYFSAFTEESGVELWKVDASGIASLVADINPSGGDSNPGFMTVFNGSLYFGAGAPTGGRELWKVNASGTPSLVADINPSGDSDPGYLIAFNNRLYFSATAPSSGRELWMLSASGTPSMVADINPAGNSDPGFLTVLNNALYFGADSTGDRGNIWKLVAAVNTPPTVNNQAFTIPENRPNGTTVGKVVATDPDIAASGDSLSYSIIAGNGSGSGAFALNPSTGVLTVNDASQLNREVTAAFNLTVQVQDQDGATDTATVTITLSEVPVDLRILSVALDGANNMVVTYEVADESSAFGIGFYRSTDAAFAVGDLSLDSITLDSAADLTAGVHTKSLVIGGGAGQIALPGAGATENDTDYFLLVVADPQNLIDETASSGGETNNTAVLTGVYHVAGGPVMVHGTGIRDVIKVQPHAAPLFVQVDFNGATKEYAANDATGVRIRGHNGNDEFQFHVDSGFGAAGTLVFLFHGGSGTNTAKSWGSSSTTVKDVAKINPMSGSLVGPGYSLAVAGLRGMTFTSQGGPDEASIYDSSLDDTFTAYPTYVTLSNSLYTNRAEGFRNVFAYAQVGGAYVPAGGHDVANFFGIEGTIDYFRASAMYGIMADGETGRGKTYFVRGNWFEQVHAFGRETNGRPSNVDRDQAMLYDAATSDLFEAETGTALAKYAFTGASMVSAHAFRVVKAYGAVADTANLYGPGTYTPGKNPVMYVSDYTVWANGFDPLDWYPNGRPATSLSRAAAVDTALAPLETQKGDPKRFDLALTEGVEA